jgi:hypothetical protein
MDELGRNLLEKLLTAGERTAAGRRSRPPVLTAGQLELYRSGNSIQQKESFDATMRAAQASGAIRLHWDGDVADNGFVERIELDDARALAGFLGKALNADRVEAAVRALQGYVGTFEVLGEVMERWQRLNLVRGLGPESTADWIDAIRVMQYAQGAGGPLSVPIREASARLFNDSKRIEKLAGPLDVLLSGRCDVGGRPSVEVFQELGLFREEQPVRLSGKVLLRRERLTALIDRPYMALSASTVLGFGAAPKKILSIENLTTFHSEAKVRCDDEVLMIYTGGMPTPAWRAMYRRLLSESPAGVEVCHWGDVDEGGFRIAALLASDARSAGVGLQPWRMAPDDVPLAARRVAQPGTVSRMAQYARVAGWERIAEHIEQCGFTAEQESLSQF